MATVMAAFLFCASLINEKFYMFNQVLYEYTLSGWNKYFQIPHVYIHNIYRFTGKTNSQEMTIIINER